MDSETTSPARLLIPTDYKSKIGKHESYPVGAELISEALAGLPMFDKLTLSFGHGGKPVSGKPIPVLTVTYRFMRMHTATLGPYWSVRILAVPREIKGAVKANLLESGLAKVRDWMNANAKVWGTHGVRRLEINWDQIQEKIIFSDTRHLDPLLVEKHQST